ncbi:peroxidase [Xylariales sp. PMI_506]|nr:peroxidase [Xylariales sp. PMI_506]
MWSTLFTATVALSALPGTLGYPGMAATLASIVEARDSGEAPDANDSTEVFGDIATLADSALTAVGRDLKSILSGVGDGESSASWSNVPALKSAACAQDPCCVWKYIADDMANYYRGASGRCNGNARAAVRLGFHDAAGWSKSTDSQGGGADGSIILVDNELKWGENNGLQDIGAKVKSWYQYWRVQQGYTSVTMADLIQVSATVATVVCPLGPRIKTYIGRPDSTKENPHLLPGVTQSAPDLIKLFEDKTIKSNGLVALLGAHTTSQQHFVDTKRSGDPQDSSPGVWDVLFYSQTTSAKTPKRVFKFQSDVAISQYGQTADQWQEFTGSDGQSEWNEYYAREYVRLSLLGVKKLNGLTECSKILPPRITSWTNPDQKNLDKWLSTTTQSATYQKIAAAMENGESLLSSIINALFSFLGLLF